MPFFGLEGSWGQPQGPNFPSPRATMLALRLDCFTAALTTPQKFLPSWKLVELQMLDFSDRTRTVISIWTSAADWKMPLKQKICPFYSISHPKWSRSPLLWRGWHKEWSRGCGHRWEIYNWHRHYSDLQCDSWDMDWHRKSCWCSKLTCPKQGCLACWGLSIWKDIYLIGLII